MNRHSYEALCESIRNHCSQKEWYGPDGYYGSDVVHIHESVSEDGRRHFRSYSQWRGPGIDHDFRAGFFPPATEEQIRLSEEVMGFPYPPLLKTLYLQVANGGFGPGYGLVGAFCGFRDTQRRRDDEYRLQKSVACPYLPPGGFVEVEHYEQLCGYPKFIDREFYEEQHKDQAIDIYSPTIWSRFFICLCDWGCTRVSYIHAQSGRVYGMDEGLLYREADSLEQWLECWLQGEDPCVDWTQEDLDEGRQRQREVYQMDVANTDE